MIQTVHVHVVIECWLVKHSTLRLGQREEIFNATVCAFLVTLALPIFVKPGLLEGLNGHSSRLVHQKWRVNFITFFVAVARL